MDKMFCIQWRTIWIVFGFLVVLTGLGLFVAADIVGSCLLPGCSCAETISECAGHGRLLYSSALSGWMCGFLDTFDPGHCEKVIRGYCAMKMGAFDGN